MGSVKFSKFSQCLGRIEQTSSRNQMTEILAELLGELSVEETDKACYLLLGRLAPLYETKEFNLAEKMMIRVLAEAFGVERREAREKFKDTGDLGVTAEQLHELSGQNELKGKLGIEEVFTRLLEIAEADGTGSQEVKVRKMAKLLGSLDSLSARYVTRIPLGQLRLGFSDVTLIDALSWLIRGDKSVSGEIRARFNICPDIGLMARTVKEKGLKGLEEVSAEVGRPIRPALSARLPSSEKIVKKLEEFAVEPKVDGLRVQIHMSKAKGLPFIASSESEEATEGQMSKVKGWKGLFEGEVKESDERVFVRVFSRNLADSTHMFPEIVTAVQKLPIESVILDGEAIAYNPDTEEFLPFQKTMQRKRKYKIDEKVKEIPIKVFVFDILYLDGRSLLGEILQKRRELLEKIVKKEDTFVLVQQEVVSSVDELKDLFALYISEGLEGVMCKRLGSVYQAGTRNFNWVKYKRGTEGVGLPDTVDGLVLGYYAGRGQRAKFGVGAFLVGVYNSDTDSFETVAKVGTGLTDEQWEEFMKRSRNWRIRGMPKQYIVNKALACDFWLEPGLVVEVDADEITRSPVHTAGRRSDVLQVEAEGEAGLSLRFPRLVRFRDKRPDDVTSTEEVLRMYGMRKCSPVGRNPEP